jgi:hypothetical protein
MNSVTDIIFHGQFQEKACMDRAIIEFLAITSIGRLLGTVMETLGGDYIRRKQYQEFFILAGIALTIIFLSLYLKMGLKGC